MSTKTKKETELSTGEADSANDPLLVGLDWGTNTTSLEATYRDSGKGVASTQTPTVVGYAAEGIIDSVLPGNAITLFGEEALRCRLHLDLVKPLQLGVIEEPKAARDYAVYIGNQLNGSAKSEIRAVVGVPANADDQARVGVRNAFRGISQKVILIPEPFLAALGFREETRLNETGYVDPVTNSLFIDVGAGSTDLCLVQGYYPLPEDQISIPHAGDAIDSCLAKEMCQAYPDCVLSMSKIKELKEQHSFAGNLPGSIKVNVIVGGKPRELDIGEMLGRACNTLVAKIFDGAKTLIARADPDSAAELLQNIVLTGGGSQIRNIAAILEKMLEDDGYAQPKVGIIGENFKEYVAKGALKAAHHAKDRQWQNLIR